MAAVSALSTSIASLSLCPAESISIPSSSRSLSSFTGLACNSLTGSRGLSYNARQESRQSPSFVVLAVEVSRKEKTQARHRRMRRKLIGTPERPRLAVFRSNKHIYVQVIDDEAKHTLAAASTLQATLREELKLTAGPTIEAARRVGMEVAKIAIAKGVSKVAFDRGGFLYHGKIKALADGAREGGLDF